VIVLDASAAIELLLNTPLGERVADRLADAGEALHAPHLLDVEVLHVVRRLCAGRTLSERRARQALADLTDLPVTRYSHQDLVARAWTMRATLTAYDAMYVALAEALDATVVTCDARLGRAHGHGVKIDVVELARS
jgi:predicted nucleic acid-binding protein